MSLSASPVLCFNSSVPRSLTQELFSVPCSGIDEMLINRPYVK